MALEDPTHLSQQQSLFLLTNEFLALLQSLRKKIKQYAYLLVQDCNKGKYIIPIILLCLSCNI